MKALYALGAIALLAACEPLPPTQPQRMPPPRPVEPVVTAPVVTPAPVAPMPVPPRDPAPVLPPVANAPGDTCGASGLQGFVGSVAPQPFPAPGPVRVYAEGDPVTMDNNPQRLNVIVDGENRQRVVSLRCG